MAACLRKPGLGLDSGTVSDRLPVLDTGLTIPGDTWGHLRPLGSTNAAGQSVAWLTPHGEYLALGAEESKRLAAYRGLFATDLDAELLREIRTSTHGGYAIGDSRFREEIEHTLNRRATPRGPGRPGESTGTR